MSSSAKFYSKETIKCDFPNCGKYMRRDRIKEHEKIHKNERKTSQGSIFHFLKKKAESQNKTGIEVHNEISDKVSENAVSIKPVGVKKFSSVPTTNNEKGFVEKIRNSFNSLFRQQQPEKSSEKDCSPNFENASTDNDSITKEDNNEVNQTVFRTKKRRLDDSNSKDPVENEVTCSPIERIEAELKLLNNKIDALRLNRPQQEVNEDINIDLKRQIRDVRTAKSIKEIQEACPVIVVLENELVCDPCHQDFSEKGTFLYDFSNGQDFGDKLQPRAFVNLKGHITRHLEAVSHTTAIKQHEARLKENKALELRNIQIGKRLGRFAYKIMKKAGSYADYEEQVAVLAAGKIEVGNIQHSWKFVSELEKVVYDVLLDRTKEILHKSLAATSRPTPLAVIADKVTPNRRTLEVVGVYGFINGKFQSIVAGVPEVISEDGVGVTRTLKKGLLNLDIADKEIETRLVGGAFDGEYLRLKIPQHLLHASLIDDDVKSWYSFQWDPAHILELAEHDARKHLNSKFVQKTIEIVGDISKNYGYGKSYRQALLIREFPERYQIDIESDDESENPDEQENVAQIKSKKFKAPRHFSNTRFATYSHKALNTFIDNYDVYYKHMERKQVDELDKIDNAPFLFTLGALDNVYEVLGNASNAVQQPVISPWEVKQTLHTYIDTLEEMSSNLNQISKLDDINKNLFPTLYKMCKSVHEKGEFNSCVILAKKHNIQRTRHAEQTDESLCDNFQDSLKTAARSVSKFTELLTNNARDRFTIENNRNPILDICGNLFDIQKIITYTNHEVIRSYLDEYVQLAKKTNNLNTQITNIEIYNQYDVFINRVKDIASDFVYKETSPNTEKVKINFPERIRQLDLYEKLYSCESLYKDIQDIVHLSLTANCRNHCEAVVEGMGSVLTLKNQQRGRLTNEAVQRETIIRWQGPHPCSDSATKLIETALDKYFNGRSNWRFISKNSIFTMSAVIDRKKKESKNKEKISFV